MATIPLPVYGVSFCVLYSVSTYSANCRVPHYMEPSISSTTNKKEDNKAMVE